MTPAELDTLTAAVRDRRVIRLSYQRNPGPRTFHPHAIYADLGGGLHVDGLQTAGPTHDPTPGPIWRTLDLSLVSSIEATAVRFVPDPRFNPGNTEHYHELIISCVAPGPSD